MSQETRTYFSKPLPLGLVNNDKQMNYSPLFDTYNISGRINNVIANRDSTTTNEEDLVTFNVITNDTDVDIIRYGDGFYIRNKRGAEASSAKTTILDNNTEKILNGVIFRKDGTFENFDKKT